MSIPLSHDKKHSNFFASFRTLLSESSKIFSTNKHIYFLIFILVTIPLSLLHFHLTQSSHPLKSQILHLEYLASRAPTRFEARQVWRESRETVLSLVYLKLIYFIPTYFLSLITAISVIATAESAYNKKPTSFSSLLCAFNANWARPLVTSICNYVVLLLYSSTLYIFWAIIGSSSGKLRFLLSAFASAFEIYIMTVLGLALVISVLDKRFGLDAIEIGLRLMGGRKVTGWVLSALLALVTSGIGLGMEELEAVRVGWGWERAVVIGLYAVVIVTGFVVNTVFYCECKKRHVVRGEEEQEMEGQQNQQSLES